MSTPADDEVRALDLAVQDPHNRKLSAVKLAAKLGADVALITGRRTDRIKIRFRWPDGTPVAPPMRLRDVLGQMTSGRRSPPGGRFRKK